MRHFIRLDGMLREVHPLTKPHRDQPLVAVVIDGTREVWVVVNHEILIDY